MCRDGVGLVWRSGGYVPVTFAPDFGPERAGLGGSTREELNMDELVGLTEEMGVNFSEEEDLSWVDD